MALAMQNVAAVLKQIETAAAALRRRDMAAFWADAEAVLTAVHAARGGPTQMALAAETCRHAWVDALGWSAFSRAAVTAIVTHVGGIAAATTVLTVGAGLGVWDALLEHAGVRVVSTDAAHQKAAFRPVCVADAETAVRDYGSAATVLFTSWPEFLNYRFTQAVLDFAAPGKFVVYVGEGPRGCTGHGLIEMLQAEWTLVAQVPIPRFYYNTDSVYIFRYDGRSRRCCSCDIM